MSEREFDRIPYSVQVEFRTASSFLVAYSVNLSRGGMFIETDSEVPTGVLLTLDLHVPGAGLLHLIGMVAWRRGIDSPDGPAGADELAANPPPFAELQVVLVRALSKPVSVQSTASA